MTAGKSRRARLKFHLREGIRARLRRTARARMRAGLGLGLRSGTRARWRAGLGLGLRSGLRTRGRQLRDLRRAWRQRLKWFRVVTLVLVILGAQHVLTTSPSDVLTPKPSSGAFTDLAIYLPPQIAVGEPVTADVVGAAPDADVSLLVGGALGTLTLTGTASGAGVTRFTVPARAEEWSGQVSLLARSGSASGRGSFELRPGAVLGPVTTVVGPSSIVADGLDQAVGVVIPMDKYGNAPSDGTPVRFRRVLPGGQVQTTTVGTKNLLAWGTFMSGKKAGINEIHAEQDTATGPNTRMDEVAGPPAPFKLASKGLLPAADGRSLLQLQTNVLRDPNGNVQADGTLVTLFGTGPVGSWRIPSSTVGGMARFTIEAPVSPGVVQLVAHCRGSISALPLTIAFAQNGSTMPTTAVRKGDDVVVSVGPVIDLNGALVDDGAVISAVARDSEGRSASGSIALVEGAGQVLLSSAALKGELTVSVSLLGIQSTFSLP